MRHQHWLSISLILSLGACGDSTPSNNTGTDSGSGMDDAALAADTGAADTGAADAGRPDTGRPDTGTSGTLDYTTVRTGRRCEMDTDCIDGQSCVPTAQGRICTTDQGCEQGARADEESQCGGRGSTCVLYGSTSTQRLDICVRGCVATATSERLGACGEGFVCTTNWLRQPTGSMESSPGCMPHCTTDAHCAGVMTGDAGAGVCNTRTGFCSTTGSNMMLLADGMACNPMNTATPQCRGLCFATSSTNRTQGLCGSFINLRTTQQCPDYDIETMAPRVPQGDNLAVCIFRNCDTNAQCSNGLVCVYPEDTMGMVRNDLPSNCGFATTAQPMGIPVSGDAGVPSDAR